MSAERHDFERFPPGRDGVEGARIVDETGVERGRVCLDRLRTATPHRITVTGTNSFLRAEEARRLATALLWAADESEAIHDA